MPWATWFFSALMTLAVLPTRAVGATTQVPNPPAGSHIFVGSRSETLWVFDADFEDLVGDNAGWIGRDKSGTPSRKNYWHKDTIRIRNFTYLGDSTWWCGTYDVCFRQNRGYGNNWLCSLARDFPLDEWSDAGDAVTFEWNQRFALESSYDYAYVDVSTDSGGIWTTLRTFTNPSFGDPGFPQDWNSSTYGHPVVDMAAYSGLPVTLRFRVTSDGAYSSQDMDDNSLHSVKDGAWQLDNFTWKVNGEVVWVDDCEAAGDNGWEHGDSAPMNQVGVAFRRSLESVLDPPRWMMVAYDESTGVAVDGENAWLDTPIIDIWGMDNLVAEWWAWVDLPSCSHDAVSIKLVTGDLPECIEREVNVWYQSAWSYSGVPGYVVFREDWSEFLGRDYLEASFRLTNAAPESIPGCHGLGFLLDRFRLGRVVAGGVPDEGSAESASLAIAPNPVAGQTRISYVLPAPGHTVLRIFDLRGSVVRTLLDDRLDAGPGSASWDGTTDTGGRAPSGVYFVRLELPGRRGAAVERKAVVLR